MVKTFNINTDNANNFDNLIKLPSNNPAFVKIFSPMCVHCQNMEGNWKKFNNILKKNYTGNCSIFNVDTDSLANIQNPHLKSITGIPSLILLNNNDNPKIYKGNRSTNDFLKFSLENMPLKKIINKTKKKNINKTIKKLKKNKSKNIKKTIKKLKKK